MRLEGRTFQHVILSVAKDPVPSTLRATRGVSLITVLLFMLVATIAATATYKWITSEGRSSSSRMLEREAYQSSVAGLENARTWMTYHANDVGDLIHQFIVGGNKPINIDGRLRSLQRAGQNYHVWMTGVNTDNSTYKVKLVSYGEARGGTRHGEAAIFNVDGLYRVNVPQESYTGEANFHEGFFGSLGTNTVNLVTNAAVINGSTDINSQYGVEVSDYLIVTGDINATSLASVENFYVNGDMKTCTGLNVTGDFYVKNNLYVNGTHDYDGNLYVGGELNLSGTLPSDGGFHCDTKGGDIEIDGNVTVEKDIIMPRHSAHRKTKIKGNLVLKNGAKLNFMKKGVDWVSSQKYKVEFLGNVFLDGGMEGAQPYFGYADSLVLGSTGKKVYSPNANIRVSNASGILVYSHWTDKHFDNQYTNGAPTGRKLGYWQCHWNSGYNANRWKNINDEIPPNTFCNGSYCAPTLASGNLIMASRSAAGQYWTNNDFYGIDKDGTSINGNCTQNFSQWCDGAQFAGYSCQETKRNEIFMRINGTPTTVKPSDTTGWGANRMTEYANRITDEDVGGCTGPHINDPIQFNEDLKGNANLYSYDKKAECKDVASGTANLWTEDNSTDRWALLEQCWSLADAAGKLYKDSWLLIKFKGENGQFSTLNSSTTLTHNYIIIFEEEATFNFPPTSSDANVIILLEKGGKTTGIKSNTNKDRNYFIFSRGDYEYNSGAKITGSVYMSDCHTMTPKATATFYYNKDLLTALTSSGIICNNNGTNKCSGSAASGSGSGGGSSAISEGGPDAYFISMAPQLGVTLESQNETSESFSESSDNVTTLVPSFIVLPRVIYLPSDPYGKLSDYYSVLPLNGSTLEKSDVSIDGCTDLDGTPMVSGGAKLTKGTIYNCTAKASGHQDVPFWVVIGDNQRGTPSIHFLESEASQQAATTTTTPLGVHVYVSAHANPISLSVTCPSLGGTCATNAAGKYYCQGGGWTYELQNGGQRTDAGVCTFTIPASADADQTSFSLFNVSTENASNGTVTFHLQQIGSDYAITSPYTAELHVSSTTTVDRTEATPGQITAWCANSTDCPSDVANWPDMNCSSDRTDIDWVDLTGTSNKGTISPNQRWSVGVGGTEEISLISAYSGDECLVIIPTGDTRSLSGVTANGLIAPLHATLKPKKKTLTVGFTGNLGGKNPKIIVNAGTSITDENRRIKDASCIHDNISGDYPKYCSYDVFPGEKVTFEVYEDANSKKFNYWKCESGNCPNLEPLNNKNYTTTPITISSEYTYTYLAHFGESDKHCFFEEFKDGDASEYKRANRGTLACSNNVEYCIDDCNRQTGCTSADNTSGYKWRLIGSPLSSLDYSSLYGYLTVKSSLNKGRKEAEKTKIVVMSSVNAGLNGDMKALMQIPSAAAHGKESRNIRGSGIILRSNNTASEYLMVNVYANNSGNLEAQVCKNGGSDCLESEELKSNGGSSASVNSSNMAMVTATINGSNLIVSAVTDPNGYYGQAVTSYSHTFDVSSITYNDRAHEYVGFSIADAKFKIHGIGWHSSDYNADCFDTYPTVKCSFAAVADSGFIPTGKWIKPWVGYSGWFTSSGTCTEKLYYYNGSDANCGSSSNDVGVLCGDYGYKFESNTSTNTTNEGPHGYQDANSKDVKTAKAWLNCPTTTRDDYNVNASWWSSATEREFAHCGYFWTGKFLECANDQADLLGSTPQSIIAGATGQVPLVGAPINLRKSSLNITLQDNTSGSVEIWLESPNTGEGCWGGCEDFPSASVTVTGNTVTFDDVVKSFPADSTGFNPEEVSRIRIKNHGTGTVKVTGVSAACTNAIDITSCKADYSESDGQWNIEMTVTNRKNITTKQYKANYLNSGDYTDGNYSANTSAGGVPCKNDENSDNKIICSDKSRDPYKDDQGKTYEFAVKVIGNSGLSTVEKTGCTVTPDKIKTISCSVPNVGPVVTSGQPLPQFNFTLSNCPGGSCDYEIYLGTTRLNDCGNGQSCFGSGTGEIAKTPVGTATECTNPNGCTQTYTVKSSNASKPFEPCSRTFTVNPRGYITASCAFSPAAVGKGAEAKLALTNIQNVETATNISVTCSNCPNGYTVEPSPNSLSGNSSENIKFYAPNSASSGYTYSVKYTPPNSNTAREICSSTPSLAVVDGLNCSNVSPTQIYLGQTFTFTPAGGGTCTSASLPKKNDGDVITAGSGSPCPTSYTVKPATVGSGQKYTYTFNGPIGTLTCDAEVDVLAPPDFSCATNTAGTVNEDVTIALTGISGCGNGCTVSVSPSVTIKNSSGTVSSSATSHSLVFEGVTSMPSPNPVQYEVTLTGGIGTKKTCPVTYSEPSTGCTVVTQSISATDNKVHINDDLSSGCADITLNKVCLGQLNVDVTDCKGKASAWNGTSFSLSNDNGTYYAQYNPSPNLTYHLEVSDCSDKAFHVYMSECNALPAASKVPKINGCPSDMTKSPNATVNTSITIDNCQVVDGCTYTITKNSVNGPATTYYRGTLPPISGEASGTYTYVISASNSKGSVPTSGLCSFDVVYSSDAPTSVDNYVPNTTLTSGRYTLEKCNGNTGSMSTQIEANFADCWDVFTNCTGCGTWNNSSSFCNGGGTVSYPVTVTVPSGKTLKITYCQ